MNHKHVSHLIDDYIDGVLNAEEKEKVELHLKECSQCRKEFSGIVSVVHDLHQLPEFIAPPAKLREAIDRTMLRFGSNRHSPRQKKARVWYLFDYKFALRLAAGLVVLIGAGVLLWYVLHDTGGVDKTVAQKMESQTQLSPARQNSSDTQSEGGGTIAKNNTSPVTSGPLSSGKTVKKDKSPAKIAARQQQPAAEKTQIGAAIHDTSNQVALVNQRPVFGQITGTIIDSLTGDPLVGANVILEGTSIGASTDINGEYKITHVPAGLHKVVAMYIGYKRQMIGSVAVKSDSSLRLDFQLPPQKIEGMAVIVTAQARGQQEAINQSLSSVVSESKIKESPDVNAAQAVGRLPGVSVSPSATAVNGLAPRSNAVRVDGITISPESRPPFNTEDYSKIDENEYKDALTNPLSTFSIDVDAASYSNIRRFINNGQLPPRDAVRIEEMINYFKYDYPQPSGRHPFSINTELSVCPWNSDHSLLLVGLQGKILNAEKLPPSNLVFLLDVSGSMNEPNKLPLVKAAFRVLVRQLRSQDRVAIVVYAGRAGLVLPSTSGDEKENILDAIDNLEAGGSTAGGQGIMLAYKVARKNFMKNGNNRVILATDGDFNVGISSEGELVRLIEDERQDNIFLSVLGFGMGNYKDSKMEKLADKGNGNYAYIDDIQEARKVLGEQMAGTLYAIAKDVKIQIEFNPAIVKSYRLIGYENRLLNKEDFKDDKKDAGELGAGHTVTALYELVLSDRKSDVQTIDSLKYQTTVIRPESFREDELSTVHLRYKPPTDTTSILLTTAVKKSTEDVEDASRNLRFASAVAMFGMILRESKYKGNANYDRVLALARESKGTDSEGYNAEFLKLVEACKLLDTRKER
jgi:Ca-activated chloride channel family protein